MAQTEHLPIYKSMYDLCLYLEQVVQHFSRYHKYALGADLRDGARRALKLVVRTNARRDKTPVLLQPRKELEELKVLVRLGQDVKAFATFKAFEHAITLPTARNPAKFSPPIFVTVWCTISWWRTRSAFLNLCSSTTPMPVAPAKAPWRRVTG
jgi:hypothetical protein